MRTAAAPPAGVPLLTRRALREPRRANTLCPAGQHCIASSSDAGVCGVAMPETEGANNAASASTPLLDTAAGGAAVRGTIVAGDADCVAVDVPAGGRLYASHAEPSGRCTPDLFGEIAIDRDSAVGARPLGGDSDSGPFDCPRVDGFSADPG